MSSDTFFPRPGTNLQPQSREACRIVLVLSSPETQPSDQGPDFENELYYRQSGSTWLRQPVPPTKAMVGGLFWDLFS